MGPYGNTDFKMLLLPVSVQFSTKLFPFWKILISNFFFVSLLWDPERNFKTLLLPVSVQFEPNLMIDMSVVGNICYYCFGDLGKNRNLIAFRV